MNNPSSIVLELLTKVLEFYANPKNYEQIKKLHGAALSFEASPIQKDKGEMAKDTLRTIKEITDAANG